MASGPGSDMVASPYRVLEDRAFWRSGGAEASSCAPPQIYHPKRAISKDLPVFAAGSCLAQQVSSSDQLTYHFAYRPYSARFGYIYMARQLRQLLRDAWGCFGAVKRPDRLNAGPFSTKFGYAKRAASLGNKTLPNLDHRHMNTEYSLAVLCAFAESYLGYPNRRGGETSVSNTYNERIA